MTVAQEQAIESAESYLQMGGLSRVGLIEQLESPYGEQFTHAQAVYGDTVTDGLAPSVPEDDRITSRTQGRRFSASARLQFGLAAAAAIVTPLALTSTASAAPAPAKSTGTVTWRYQGKVTGTVTFTSVCDNERGRLPSTCESRMCTFSTYQTQVTTG